MSETFFISGLKFKNLSGDLRPLPRAQPVDFERMRFVEGLNISVVGCLRLGLLVERLGVISRFKRFSDSSGALVHF